MIELYCEHSISFGFQSLIGVLQKLAVHALKLLARRVFKHPVDALFLKKFKENAPHLLKCYKHASKSGHMPHLLQGQSTTAHKQTYRFLYTYYSREVSRAFLFSI